MYNNKQNSAELNDIPYGERLKKRFQENIQSSFVKKSRKLLAKRQQQQLPLENNLNESTTLNSWIRQQGGGSEIAKQRTRFSGISNNNNNSKILTEISTDNNIEMTNQNGNSTYFRIPTTPKPVSTFHLKCIDDVFKHNEPKDMFIDDPKELIYIKKLPFLKLSIFGVGSIKDYLWELKNVS